MLHSGGGGDGGLSCASFLSTVEIKYTEKNKKNKFFNFLHFSVVAQITSQPQLVVADPNGNHDSGYAPSNVDDVLAGAADSSPPDSPVASGTLKRSSISSGRRNTADGGSPKREPALR